MFTVCETYTDGKEFYRYAHKDLFTCACWCRNHPVRPYVSLVIRDDRGNQYDAEQVIDSIFESHF